MNNQSKIINIIIIILVLLTIAVCLFFVLRIESPTERDIYLVEQTDSLGNKLVSDNSYYQNIEKRDNGTVIYSAHTHDKILNPEDTIVPGGSGTNKQGNDESIITYVDTPIIPVVPIKSDSDITEPYEIYGADEVIEIVASEDLPSEDIKETDEKPENFSAIKLATLQQIDREKRNEGRIYIWPMINFKSLSEDWIYFEDIREKPIFIVPFTLEDSEIENIKSALPLYEKNKNEVEFLFVYTVANGDGDSDLILKKLNSEGIRTDIPLYIDGMNNIALACKGERFSYILVNYDGYIYKSGVSLLSSEMFDGYISDLNNENDFARSEENRIENEYYNSLSSEDIEKDS